MGKYTFRPIQFEAEQFQIPDGQVLGFDGNPPKPPKKGQKARKVKTNAEFHFLGEAFTVFLDHVGPFVKVGDDILRPGDWAMETPDGPVGCDKETFQQMYVPASHIHRASAADKFRGHLMANSSHGKN